MFLRVVAVIAVATAVAFPAEASSLAASGAPAGVARARAVRAGDLAFSARTPTMGGGQLWATSYNGPFTPSSNQANAVAVSPDGSVVYVAGTSYDGQAAGDDFATVAYDAVTGRQLWVSRSRGPSDSARAIAVSPSGGMVFVTGHSQPFASGYGTVAYDAATGRRLWFSRYDAPAGGVGDQATAVAVSPNGRAVFVTGLSLGTTFRDDYATVAYNATTGSRLWVRRYDGPGHGDDDAYSVAVSPSGAAVYVTGVSQGRTSGADYATVAYNAATGKDLWVRRYNGPGNGADGASSIAVSPAGGAVFVTGRSAGRAATGYDYATVAYAAATGKYLWVRRYNGPSSRTDSAQSVAVSPGGASVYVTGVSDRGNGGTTDYATVAYNAATGAQRWARRYVGHGRAASGAAAVAVSPGGARVYVTGTTAFYSYATVAYNAATGAQLWASTYSGTPEDLACCIAVSPKTGTIYISGSSYSTSSGWDYATVAYRR